MTAATITCPGCKAEIKLTESLAAPLLAAVKRDYERRLEQKDADMEKYEAALKEREALLAKEKATLEEQIAEKLRQARIGIAADEARKAKLALGQDLEDKSRAITELQQILEQRDIKLAEAQKAQADLLRKQRELDDAKREMDITIEKRVQQTIDAARNQARNEAEEALKLRVLEKEQTIASMQKQLEELKRKAEQGSQQLQGEVLELQLEALLGAKFPQDLLEPVPKGEHGGDLIQRIRAASGQMSGTILWETKRTKNWSDGHLGQSGAAEGSRDVRFDRGGVGHTPTDGRAGRVGVAPDAH